jgi:hypothetical protein
VSGEVTATEAARDRSHARNAHEPSTEVVSFRPQLRFRYVVDRMTWLGERVSFRAMKPDFSSEAAALETIAAYPLDAEVTVYYNPEKPWIAVLEPGVQFRPSLGTLALGGFFAFLGVCALIFVYCAARLLRRAPSLRQGAGG